MKKIIRIIKKIFRWIFHPVRSTKSAINRKINKYTKFIIVTYLLTLIPSNYGLTSLTKGINLGNTSQIVQEIANKGLGNFALLGIPDLLKNTFNQGNEVVKAIDGIFAKKDGSEIRTVEQVVTDNSVENLSETARIENYEVLGKSKIDVNNMPSEGRIVYGGLDSLGRTLEVKGTINYDLVEQSKGHREKFKSDADPSGWATRSNYRNEKEVITYANGKIYRGKFYNRSHLIADQLGGKAVRENVITGTRSQNVGTGASGGMRYSEKKVVDYLNNNQGSYVYYMVTPVYQGDELVPRYVDVQVLSKEGEINEYIRVYNRAEGFTIDYTTGEYSKN